MVAVILLMKNLPSTTRRFAFVCWMVDVIPYSDSVITGGGDHAGDYIPAIDMLFSYATKNFDDFNANIAAGVARMHDVEKKKSSYHPLLSAAPPALIKSSPRGSKRRKDEEELLALEKRENDTSAALPTAASAGKKAKTALSPAVDEGHHRTTELFAFVFGKYKVAELKKHLDDSK